MGEVYACLEASGSRGEFYYCRTVVCGKGRFSKNDFYQGKAKRVLS